MSTHNLCFEQKCEKYQSFLSENFQFLEVKLSIYLNRHFFVMSSTGLKGNSSALDKMILGVVTQLKFMKKQLKLNLWSKYGTQIPVFLAPINKTDYPKEKS